MYYLSTYAEWLNKIINNVSQSRQCYGQDRWKLPPQQGNVFTRLSANWLFRGVSVTYKYRRGVFWLWLWTQGLFLVHGPPDGRMWGLPWSAPNGATLTVRGPVNRTMRTMWGIVRFQVLTASSMKVAAFWDLIMLWRWRHYVPPKRRTTSTRLHSAISQKAVTFLWKSEWR